MSICKDEGLLIMYIISIEIQHILKDQILLISEAVNLKAECFHAAYQLYCTPKSVDVIYSIQIIIIFFFMKQEFLDGTDKCAMNPQRYLIIY